MATLHGNPPAASGPSQANVTRGILRRGAQVLGTLVLYGLLLFGSAGRLDWMAAWIFLAINAAVIVVNSAILLAKNPAFVAARGQVREDAKDWDKQITALAGVFMVAGLIVPGLDLRLDWSGAFALPWQLIGFLVVVVGYALFSWAMISNEFFETKVRIQADRGQTVATSGPYRYVRHPGYIGMILQLLGTPLALASWWGLIPAACAAVAFVVRTALEDSTLQQELAGYADYARRVPYRLLPGVW
jgi:protein-S-isoprenylcysteine O-methyltransferase Ste14